MHDFYDTMGKLQTEVSTRKQYERTTDNIPNRASGIGLQQLGLAFRLLYLRQTLLPLRDLVALCSLLRRTARGGGRRDGCLRKGYTGVVRGEARDTDIVIAF